MKSKKAQLGLTVNIGALIWRLIYILIIVVTIRVVVMHFIAVNIDVREAEGKILINRFIYSPDCISYANNEIGMVYPGIIDLQKFSQKTLENCVYYGERNDYAAANLTLHFLDTSGDMSVIYNQLGYDVWLPRVNMAGPGGAKAFYDSRYVLVRDNNNLRRAVLDIEVITPNY